MFSGSTVYGVLQGRLGCYVDGTRDSRVQLKQTSKQTPIKHHAYELNTLVM